MYKIVYFDLSDGGSRIPLANGTETSIEHLLKLISEAYPEAYATHRLPLNLKQMHFEPKGHWRRVLNALSLGISGRLISEFEMKNLCRLIYDLPPWCKIAFCDIWNSVALMAYLAVGFRTHPDPRHLEDSNSVNDLVNFIAAWMRAEEAEISSFLCTHRGPTAPGGSWLAEQFEEDQAGKALRLQLALLANAPHLKRRSLLWKQQTDTVFASVNMFPELFLRYAEQGRVAEMLSKLAAQEKQMLSFMDAANPTRIDCRMERIDSCQVEVLRFMRHNFGPAWRTSDYSKCSVPSELMTIALDLALPEVERLMPFYRKGGGIALHDPHAWISRNEENCSDIRTRMTVRQTMRWFLANYAMHPTAKALYDSAFYYEWGRRCAHNSGKFAIGIDRDHSAFQVEAWKLGFRHEAGTTRPGSVLYARRVERPDRADPYLNGLSFRQFWR